MGILHIDHVDWMEDFTAMDGSLSSCEWCESAFSSDDPDYLCYNVGFDRSAPVSPVKEHPTAPWESREWFICGYCVTLSQGEELDEGMRKEVSALRGTKQGETILRELFISRARLLASYRKEQGITWERSPIYSRHG